MARWAMYSCGALSLLLLIVSVVLLLAHTFMETVEGQVKKATVLKNGTEVFNNWVNPPPPIYMQFYFFNVTNPLEVLDGEKPVVDEIGPYTYREYRPKEDIEFLENGTEVSAVNPKTYIFEPDKSVGNPEVDLIRTVNIPIVTLLQITRNNKYFKYIKPIVDGVLKTYNEGVFLTRSVHELLWGYKDPVLSMVHTVVPDISDMFGLFYQMNATNDGTYVFLSGSKGYMDFTKIVEWKGERNLMWWTSDTCNMINGTDGTSFHPLIDKDDIIYMFSSDLCRSVYAVYEASESVKGIPVFRFTPPAKVFANVTINPDNAGFCVPEGNCLPSGLLNVSACKQGAPIILSSPHFYQAEESVIANVVGMNPKKEYHETFLDISPLTGMVIRAAKRMQVNVYVTKIPEYEITQKIQTLYFPVMYLNESVLIDDESAGKLKSVLLEARVLANVPFIIMALGIIFGIVFVVLVCRPSRTREESSEEERGPLIRTS
ncbi:lysosome membrane protein 2 isoform X2 [Bufo bufo]|uniref:lysosome membrane protein 2 isoform X1 n=1 Tax=Bufo bufo TaxID=8384 RepID=UPI001ABEE275|nr:lysosome membrane protein 2 isoform X1 [Bufo bufo]XP_040273893.1 lysosome membrane protein 2 isoform X2 [Bufo bufo]